MAGRQFFPGFGNNFQPAPDFSSGYGNAFTGIPNNIFMPGPHAVPGQQLGGHPSGLRLPFSSQQAEDPALFVNFDDDDEDFAMNSRAAVARNQAMNVRRPAPQMQASMQPPNVSRQQQMGGSDATLPMHSCNSHPSRNMSAAEQELEDLKRRIAEKERQMKAKRQGSQGFGGMPARSRPNPAHGPILRGLHRKPPIDPPSQVSKEADLFLKNMAAELPTSSTGPPAASQRAQAAAGTQQTSKVTASQGRQPTVQATKTASAPAAKGVTSTAEHKTAGSAVASKQQKGTAAKQTAKQPADSQPAAAAPKATQTSIVVPKPSQTAAIAHKSSRPAKTTQPPLSSTAPASAKPLLPARVSPAAQKAAVKPQASASAAVKPAKQSPTRTTPDLTVQQARTNSETPLTGQAATANTSKLPSKPSATDKPGGHTQSTKAGQTDKGAPSNALPSKVAAPPDVISAEPSAEWETDPGVPVQSGYAMSDSPLPEEEDYMREGEVADIVAEANRATTQLTSILSVPKADRQQKQDKAGKRERSKLASAPREAAASETKTAVQSEAAPLAQKPTALSAPAPASAQIATQGAASALPSSADAKGASVAAPGGKVTPRKIPSKVDVPADAKKSEAKESVAPPSASKATADRRSSDACKADTPSHSTKQPSSAPQAAAKVQAHTPHGKLSSPDSAKKHSQVAIDTAKASNNKLPTPTGSKVSAGKAPFVAADLPARDKGVKAAEAMPLAAAASIAALSEAAHPEFVSYSATNGTLSKASTPAAVAQGQLNTQPAAAQQKAAAQSEPPASTKAAVTTKPAAASKQDAGHSTAVAQSSSLSGKVDRQAAPVAPLREVTPPLLSSASKGRPHSVKARNPIPGLGSPDLSASDEDVPSSSKGQAAALSASDQRPRPLSVLNSAAPPPPPTLSAPSLQATADPLPPEPSSPKPLPIASSGRDHLANAQAGLQKGFSSRSYSGEDMDIDEEPAREPLPPLPTEPFPTGLELATIDTSQQLATISAEDRDTLMEELSGINARTDELRIQKHFLNDMFARVKQEYLERRLRQQQIEQLLGYKPHMAALPSTAADAPGPSSALALRQASEGPSEPQQASPGDHKQSRKAELQSRAELHKARLDALQAKQRQGAVTAADTAPQIGMSPMTSKAIVDLTAKQSPLARQSTATVAPAPAPFASAAHKATAGARQATAAAGSAAAKAASAKATPAQGAAAAKPAPAPAQAASAVVSLQPTQHQSAVGQSKAAAQGLVKQPVGQSVTAAQKLEKQADSQARGQLVTAAQGLERQAVNQSVAAAQKAEKQADSQGKGAASVGTSQLLPKRKRSRSRSPTGTVDDGRARVGSQRQAASSSHRRATRSKSPVTRRSRSPPAKRPRQQQAPARSRQRSMSTTSSSSLSPKRRRRRHSSSSSPSPVRHGYRHSRRSPPRHRVRRSPSPRGRSRRHSPARKPSTRRSPSPLAQRRRASSPSRLVLKGGPRGSPVSRSRPEKRHTGRARSPSTSRTPSPTKRQTAAVQPAQQRRHDSPQKAVMRQSSPVAKPKADTGRLASGSVAAAKSDAPAQLPPAKPVEPTAKPHDAAQVSLKMATPAVDKPAPQPAAPPASALPDSLAQPANQQLPLVPQQPQPSAAKPRHAPKVASSQDGIVSLGRTPKRAYAKPAVEQPSVANYPKPQQQGQAKMDLPAAVTTANASSAGANVAEVTTDGIQPARSFDGKASFISLDFDEAPASTAASVKQQTAAAAVPLTQSLQQGQQAKTSEAAPLPDTSVLHVATPVPQASAAAAAQNAVQVSTTAQTPAATAVAAAAAAAQQAMRGIAPAQTDKDNIRPDVFSPASKQRPASAPTESPSTSKANEADAGQKPIAPPKGKVTGRGNIQIVLATKHKQEASKSGLPFPSTFQALAAQGLPPQGPISAEQLTPIPQPHSVAQAETAGYKYDSPLKAFRSYRLLSTFQTVSQLPLTSLSFTNRLDPHWPLCTYDIRGSCRDAKCLFQHASHYQLENVAMLRDLHQQAVRMGSKAALPTLPGGEITSDMMTALSQQAIRGIPNPSIALPSAPGASPAPSPSKSRAQARIPKEHRRQLASEDPLPLYTSAGTGPLATHDRPFTSQLLQSVPLEHAGVLRLLLSGLEGYESLAKDGPVGNAGSPSDQASRQSTVAQPKPADKMAGRYFQLASHEASDSPTAAATAVAAAPKAAETAASDEQRSALLTEYEQQVAAEPENEEAWLLFALQHIDFGVVDSMQGHKLLSCLKCISKGLEADSSFTCLWLLYLPLYRRHLRTKPEPDNESHKVAETCLSHSKPCYQLWLTAVHFQPDWQSRATLLQKGIVALSQTRPGGHGGVSKEEAAGWAAMRSSCVLDLALRLLLLWTSAEAHDLAANWVAELVKLAGQGKAPHTVAVKDPLAMEERALGPAARQALLAQLRQQPGNAAVLWLACAHLAAYNTLPPQTVHRLGCIQQPVVVDWQQAPPASLHSRVRSILATAASAGLACLDLKTTPQVMDAATIQSATSSTWPRQALALTIAHWELTTQAAPLLGPLPIPPGQGPLSPAAASLLLLGSLTSKAACTVQQPLPAQAMDTWQHATWPVGDTELLCMSVVLAAESQLQAFAEQFGKGEMQGGQQAGGRLQQAVSAAGSLLMQLASTVCKAIESTTEMDKPDDEEEEQQPLGLHPAAVGSLAARAYQLSSGYPQAAMAFLVAAVLPEWQWEVTGAGQVEDGPAVQGTNRAAPIVLSDDEEDPQTTPVAALERARVYRKRDRSASRSVTPCKPRPPGTSPHSSKRRQNRHSSSSSSGSSSYSDSDSSSGSSSRSSGSYSSSDVNSSSNDSLQPDTKRRRYADAISEGLHSELSADAQDVGLDWPVVEASGTLAELYLVTSAFQELSRLAVPSQDPQDFEEGEIRAVDQDMRRRHAAHWGHNLALYRALGGQAPGALTALQAALLTADGSCYLQRHIWQETLHLASAVLPTTSEANADSAITIPAEAHVSALLKSQSPEGLRQKLGLLQQFQGWQQEDAALSPLALPTLPIQDARARALLDQQTMHHGEVMKDAVLAMLTHLNPAQETALIEAMASGMPATAAKAQLLLDLAARKPQEGQYASWMLPLATTALLNAAPPPAPHLWLQGIVLAERHSRAAALELSTCATARHPQSKALSKRHSALQASADGPAASTSSGVSKARADL